MIYRFGGVFMFGLSCSKRFKACGKKKIHINYFLVFVITVVMIMGLISWKVSTVIQPSLESLSEIKAKEMVSYIINEATREQFFKESTNIKDLLIINSDKEGNIELVQSNTVAMNILAADLGKRIKDMYRNIEPATLKVPVGTILGSQLMSQADVNVNLKIMPLSVSNVEFFSELESKGINQTKYKVYLSLTSKVRVMAPFSSETLEVNNIVLVSEAVILGKVPNSYVNIPEQSILDGMDVGQ